MGRQDFISIILYDHANTNFIGIDVFKLNVHIYQLEIKEYLSIKNDYKVLLKFFKKFNKSSFFVYEPTGVYSKNLEKVFNDLWLQHFQVHPNDMHHLGKSLLGLNKTDKIDSKHIAQIWKLLYTQYQDLWWKNKFITPVPNYINQINHHMSQIRFMKKEISRAKNWIECLLNNPYESKTALGTYNKVISDLEKSIEKLEKEIDNLLNKNELHGKIENIKTIPWIADTTALELFVFFISLASKWMKKEDHKKVIAYSGLNPIENSSWTSLHKEKISKKWNKNVRKALYLPWIQRSQLCEKEKYKNTTIGKFCVRMKNKFTTAKNKRWKSVACAVAKKLLHTAWAMFCDNTQYSFV